MALSFKKMIVKVIVTVVILSQFSKCCHQSSLTDSELLMDNEPLRLLLNKFSGSDVLSPQWFEDLSEQIQSKKCYCGHHVSDSHASHNHQPLSNTRQGINSLTGNGYEKHNTEEDSAGFPKQHSSGANDDRQKTARGHAHIHSEEGDSHSSDDHDHTGSSETEAFSHDKQKEKKVDSTFLGRRVTDRYATHTQKCSFMDFIRRSEFGISESQTVHSFLKLCPSLLLFLLEPPCMAPVPDSNQSQGHMHTVNVSGHHHHNHSHGQTDSYKEMWIGSSLSIVVIGIIGMSCIMIIPILRKSLYYTHLNHFLLALAVGTLAGDALIHLLPHALTTHISVNMNSHLVHAVYGFTALCGIFIFLFFERCHNTCRNGHMHSHSHGPISPVDDEYIKEVGSANVEFESLGIQNLDRIGEKLSQHSKHSSFVYPDLEASEPRGCFDGCPSTPGIAEDANGNNGCDSMLDKPDGDQTGASSAERERLVISAQPTIIDQSVAVNGGLGVPSHPIVSPPPKLIVRQDSNSFNMVLQEYHVGHHGHSHHGHSHVTGKRKSLSHMILLGDALHSFMDGLAIGAAYGTSLTGGVATAIAVLCHELPHKVGDFALLFEMGMKRKVALRMVLVLWCTSLIGMLVGLMMGSVETLSPWIYSLTAGVFLYLALVDLLSEISVKDGEPCSAAGQLVIQALGMLVGAGIMLLIAIFEHDLEDFLEGFF